MSDINNSSDMAELKKFFWDAACILRTTMDPGNYKDFIFPIIFLKHLNDQFIFERDSILKKYGNQEQAEDPDMYVTCFLPENARWQHIRETTFDVGQTIADAMQIIEDSNQSFRGIFGNANWGNKQRLSDELLLRLIEHLSQYDLSSRFFSGDELGIAYEYLLGKFADDSGHDAQEFFTNRTLITMMVDILQPQEGDDIYDPTCGSSGMFVMCHNYLKENNMRTDTVKYYGQEKNRVTAAIGRMNLYIHGVNEFDIAVGNTLTEPYFRNGSQLQTFDVILANPPYSIKTDDIEQYVHDPYGRNSFGVPPKSCLDYLFIQHILKSMDPVTGRCAILLPHGVLFRDFEKDIRTKFIESDLLECVIGIAPGLFYNSPMEACIMICRSQKTPDMKGKIKFIDAKDVFIRVDNHANISDENRKKIVDAYRSKEEIEHFSKIVPSNKLKKSKFRLSLYVDDGKNDYVTVPVKESFESWSEGIDQITLEDSAFIADLKKEVL